jgi:hypothetical protein
MTPDDYKKLQNDLRYVVKLANDGMHRDDKEYKDICLRLIRHYVVVEILMDEIEEDD